MAELSLGLDPQAPRFSSNFLDDLDVTKDQGDVAPPPGPKPSSPVSTNPFRSESPTPSDPGAELNQDASGFDFAAHLDTHDSVSSLEQVGLSSPISDQSTSPAHQASVNGINDDHVDTTEAKAETKAPPTLVARTSEHWETFDEKNSEPHPPTANGGHGGAQGDREKKGESSGLNCQGSREHLCNLIRKCVNPSAYLGGREGGEERERERERQRETRQTVPMISDILN